MQETVEDRARPPVRMLASVALALLLTPPLAVAVAALSGIGHRWIDLVAQFTGPALIIAVAIVAAAAAMRARALLMAAVVVSALVLFAGSAQWAPPRGTAEPGSATLTLYSANLHRDNEDVAAIRRSVQASGADLVVLIEVGPVPASALDRILAGYPHRVIRPSLDRAPGATRSVIAGRRPVADVRPRIRALSVVGARAETALGPVTVAGVHMTRPWPYQIQWEQIRQAEGLVDWAAATPGPLLAAGDFNSVSSARIGSQLKANGRLIPAPGWPGTWPSELPPFAGITIDQVYRSPELALVERRLGRDTGSDHRPVITRFVRATPQPAP
ncbi:endonuclease/exonuclease/phosphatase family protein [Brevundimonas sp. R86498]|uniref:endonuclease/exonuclease/phosphatase family protein n=1 Tax=Brevundimonas sp. R86498 TaxID=3093845 RepID=UPI0037C4FB69